MIEALNVLYHKHDSAEVHKMTEAMGECNIHKESLVNEQGVKIANYYDSMAEQGINFPKTPGNDLILTSLYEAMLKSKEIRLQNQQKLLVNKTASFKRKGKPKGGAKAETVCFHCKGTGHWKRNCKIYMADKKKGIIVIKVNIIDVLLACENSKSWVFDTG